MLKVFERWGILGKYLNIIKAIYIRPTAIIKLNGEKLKSQARQNCLFSPYLFNGVLLKVLVGAVRPQKEIKGIHIGKEEVNVLLITNDRIVYISSPKNSSRSLLQMINSFSNVAGYKIN